MRWTAVCLVVCASCTTVRNVPQEELGVLRQGGLEEAVVLGDRPGPGMTRVRLGPNTALRFTFSDQTQSPWLWASELSTDGTGARVSERFELVDGAWIDAGPYTFLWSDVASVEADNFSGSKTLAYLGANAALAVILLPLSLAGPAGLGDGPGRASEAIAGSVPEPSSDRRPTALANVRPSSTEVSLHGERALFSKAATRRGVLQVVMTGEATALRRLEDGTSAGIFTGLRLYDAFEIGMSGARVMTPHGAGYALAFRTGGHFHLDGDYLFAVPLFIEVGRGPDIDSMFRLGYGLRVRLGQRVFGGVYAFNPRYTNLSANIPSAGTQGWHFAHGLEVGAAF